MQIENAEWEDTTGDRLAAAMKTLDPRARDILVSRWTGEGKATLHDLADKYGVSAERVRQIEANAIKKLRGLMVDGVKRRITTQLLLTRAPAIHRGFFFFRMI